ncbi:hypothetical protein DYB32_010416 [Aphanomyces invadans]|uniref:DUF659 domain-containing protein n=1 Tax=Aphanomyces invadans TaxID=157072 RepID=A0A3R6YRA6_9STRA|nr:hypothetical protein DYB32_010416 [Aphanomyces invadans]
MAVSPSCCLYLEAVLTGQQGHDHEFIVQDVQCVFKTYQDTTFAGAAMDNTSANKKAWEALKKVYPSRFFQGYTTHGLHLLVMDIFAATKTKKGGSTEPTYPTDCLFEDMLLFIDMCKDVVKFFHNHHVVEEKLEEMQKITGYCHQRKLHFTFEEAIAVLEPIDTLILTYEFDKVPISE